MKLSILEPLGIPQEQLVNLVKDAIGEAELEIVTFADRKEDEATLVERSQGADLVMFSNIKYPASVMEQLPQLKYICCAFTGFDHIDMDYARANGIQVANCAGYSTTAVAELAIAFAIDLTRNVVPCDKVVRAGGTKAGLVGAELEGRNFGVVGCGAIGTRVAKLAAAFDCKVLAYSRTPKDIPGVGFVSLDELMAKSDFVSLHVPSNAQTAKMIGAEQIALMKPTAYLINTARGPVVDSQALADALNEGRIAGAALDVFEMEPPIPGEHPLLNAKNVLATPHIAFASTQAFEKRAVICAQNVATYLAGEPQNLV